MEDSCCMRKKDFATGSYFCNGYQVKECPNSKKCRYYKPVGCMDWVRVDDMIYPLLGNRLDLENGVKL